MKRSTRSFLHKVLRSRKRLFADRYEDEDKCLRIIFVSFFDTQVNKFNIFRSNQSSLIQVSLKSIHESGMISSFFVTLNVYGFRLYNLGFLAFADGIG
ncbi:hypothetical protein Hanom_Chr13g01183951 [Helianthus anomalus]